MNPTKLHGNEPIMIGKDDGSRRTRSSSGIAIGSASGRAFVDDEGERIADRVFHVGGIDAPAAWIGECVCGFATKPAWKNVVLDGLGLHVRTCRKNRAIRGAKY